jgi:single-strand DNA-binding protein
VIKKGNNMATRSLNKVLLIGNLTRDPNLRYTPNGAAVCSFGIATNRTWAGADGGEKQERVEFHNIVAWSKLGEICGQLLHKGDKVFVEGRLQTREWKTEDNQDRRTTEVVIDNMILLRSSNGAGASAADEDEMMATTAAPKAAAEETYTDQVSEVEDISDDIPF